MCVSLRDASKQKVADVSPTLASSVSLEVCVKGTSLVSWARIAMRLNRRGCNLIECSVVEYRPTRFIFGL